MIELLFFGQLTDVTGTSSMQWEDVRDTDSLLIQINERYPQLMKMKFVIAVNNKMITESMNLDPGSKIAFMPPFSGG